MSVEAKSDTCCSLKPTFFAKATVCQEWYSPGFTGGLHVDGVALEVVFDGLEIVGLEFVGLEFVGLEFVGLEFLAERLLVSSTSIFRCIFSLCVAC